jgi:hypothetical protein
MYVPRQQGNIKVEISNYLKRLEEGNCKSRPHSRICNGNFNLHTRFNSNRGNLLNNIWGAEEVNNSLVDTKLESIPSVGTCKPENKNYKIVFINQESFCFS